ncbi:MAG: methylphosphotriester-DNA--protein-cysteine methyltransferase family protein [Gemmatimonadaceae bacterium]|nr:methylphosphotriester-DNA--protein-cysteine methyltransferase family protein [Gemmatimonadaceae bacterium]
MTTDATNALWHHAVETRDPTFDGVFFVAITSTKIYCRPVCPSRTARPENRRFFMSCSDAEAAGFRACKRCRPDAQSGQTPLDVVPRLARQVVAQISSGALNGQSVRALANTLDVSDRHLRRALSREVGASPFRLALAQRLRAATALLSDARLTITHVAYASGFQSLRRFNAAFRQEFRMSPSEWRQRGTGA